MRLGFLRGERLGHFALEPEVYLCERDAGFHAGHDDVFTVRGPVCNSYLAEQWARHLTIQPGDHHRREMPWVEGADPHGLIERTAPHLTFTDEEHQRGRALLKQLGVNGPHVLFHARDGAYLDQALPRVRDWRYHDHRDASIGNYLPAMAEMVRRGYSAVRYGAIVSDPLPPQACGRGIVDYSTSGRRSDFLDVYLMATCRFAVVSASGPAALAAIFRRPVVFANVCPLLTAHKPTFPMARLFLPKLYQDQGRTLTVAETVARGLDNIGEACELGDVDVIENTPAEIAAVAREMDDRLNGTWEPHPDDEALQARFWDAAGMPVQRCRVGAEFLRDHPELLGGDGGDN